ncbi:MAG TPA: hypothetical protein VJZ68_01880 [Nitrososphaera sp.]|nr:hypothetical protein [Nitrososphaera sp.]
MSELQPVHERESLRLDTDDKTPKAAKEMSVVLQLDVTSKLTRTRLFLICDDCYWCASAITTRLIDIDSCPQCKKQVSSIPLADNERYTYNYDESHGEEVDFWSTRQTTRPS